jgi:hypothetical protein
VAESIEHLKKIYAKKTLGQFLDLLRAKIGISPEFDEFMTDYIEQRNFITHNISRTTIFSPYTDLGREKLMNFLTSFRFMNRKAKLTFMALTEAWMRLALTDQENETRLSALKECKRSIKHTFKRADKGPMLSSRFPLEPTPDDAS